MRRVKKSVVIVTMMFFSIILFSMTNVHAANKKLKVNKVYTTTNKIKGKTKKKYLVKVKIGKKIYKKKASSKGNFSIKIPKQNPGKKIKIKVYRRKNKKWKLYTKKTVTVKKKSKKVVTNTTKKNKYPGKEDPIDLKQVNKDIASGKTLKKGQTALGPGHYYYSINYTGCLGTLYYTAAGDGEKSLKDLEDPSDASQSLKSGQKATFKCNEYDAGKYDNFNLKVKAYKNGKLIAISYMWHYMIKLIALH